MDLVHAVCYDEPRGWTGVILQVQGLLSGDDYRAGVWDVSE